MKGMKSGSAELLLARDLPARGLPRGAFLTGCFLTASTGGFALWPRPITFVAFAGFDFGLSAFPPIRGQGPADIVGFSKRRAELVAPDMRTLDVLTGCVAAKRPAR